MVTFCLAFQPLENLFQLSSQTWWVICLVCTRRQVSDAAVLKKETLHLAHWECKVSFLIQMFAFLQLQSVSVCYVVVTVTRWNPRWAAPRFVRKQASHTPCLVDQGELLKFQRTSHPYLRSPNYWVWNANQNPIRICFAPIRVAIVKKENKKITSAGKGTGKLEPPFIASGIVKWFSQCEKQFGSFSES